MSKTVNGVEHKYIWQGDRLLSESYVDTELEFFYDESGKPYSMSYKADTNAEPVMYYYVTNLQGDIMSMVDAEGFSVAEYYYNAWGLPMGTMGAMAKITPLRYRGYYFDTETGLYYLKSRYYDPYVCRFINSDSCICTGQGFIGCNTFAYCINNPICYIDPDGYMPRVLNSLFNKAKTLIRRIKDSLVEAKQKKSSGTLVIGINASVGFGLGVGFNAGIGIDNNGNIGLVAGHSEGASLPTFSGAGFISVSNAEVLEDLRGESIVIGASAGELGTFGGEISIMPNSKKNKTYLAINAQLGVGIGAPIEAHCERSVGFVESFNYYDFLIAGCDYALN